MPATTVPGPIRFAFHDRVSATAPDAAPFRLYARVASGEALSREEKDEAAAYANGHPAGLTQFMGWLVNWARVLPWFVVDIEHRGLQYAYGHDKTAVRRAMRGHGRIRRIIPVPDTPRPH